MLGATSSGNTQGTTPNRGEEEKTMNKDNEVTDLKKRYLECFQRREEAVEAAGKSYIDAHRINEAAEARGIMTHRIKSGWYGWMDLDGTRRNAFVAQALPFTLVLDGPNGGRVEVMPEAFTPDPRALWSEPFYEPELAEVQKRMKSEGWVAGAESTTYVSTSNLDFSPLLEASPAPKETD
jgi:hypothetical protein